VYATEVGTVLLSCAFFYDIFWVFASKWFFHESVMIMVSWVVLFNSEGGCFSIPLQL
ncbi:hypothetical protein SOVF_172180, partial [Spinacia oleracea]